MKKRILEQVVVLDKFWIRQQLYFWLLNDHSVFLVRFNKYSYINQLNINRLTILVVRNENLQRQKRILHNQDLKLTRINRIVKQIVGFFLIQIVKQQQISEPIYHFCFQTLTETFKIVDILRILLLMAKITGIKIPSGKWKSKIRKFFQRLPKQQLDQLLKEIENYQKTNHFNLTKISAWLLVGFWCEQLIYEAGLVLKRNFYDEIQKFIQELVD